MNSSFSLACDFERIANLDGYSFYFCQIHFHVITIQSISELIVMAASVHPFNLELLQFKIIFFYASFLYQEEHDQ